MSEPTTLANIGSITAVFMWILDTCGQLLRCFICLKLFFVLKKLRSICLNELELGPTRPAHFLTFFITFWYISSCYWVLTCRNFVWFSNVDFKSKFHYIRTGIYIKSIQTLEKMVALMLRMRSHSNTLLWKNLFDKNWRKYFALGNLLTLNIFHTFF